MNFLTRWTVRSKLQPLLSAALLLCWSGCGSTTVARPSTPQACDKAECQASCEAIVRNLNTPGDPALIAPFTSTRCVPAGQDAGSQAYCECERGIAAIPLHGSDVPSDNPAGCLYYGKGFQCLYSTEEFPGCDLKAPETSCQAVCDDLLARLRTDTARALDATAHGGVCSGEDCFCTVALSDKCYVSTDVTAYDCSLSAEEIVRLRSGSH